MESRNNTSVPMTNSTPRFGFMINAPPFNLGLVIVLGALIPVTIIGNSLVCFAFLKFQKIRTATNCFLFNLALSDLAVGLVLIPLWIAYIATGGFHELPRGFHNGWYVFDITCSVASMANLAGVSIERWYGVCYPFRHMSMSVNYAVLTSIASWAYGFGVGSIYLFYDPLNPWAITVITCLGLCLPFVVMTLSYCAIARKIKQKASLHQSSRECKTIRTLIMLTTIFILCWLPFAVSSLVANYCLRCALYVLERPTLAIFPKVLHYANSCVNPILYSLFSPSFKSAFRQILYGSRRRRNGTQRRSTMTSDGSNHTRLKLNSGRSVVVSFKEKRNSNYSDNNRNSLVNEKFV